jgi:hypothetical protein
MKPCASNKKSLTWLASGALEPDEAEALRKHILQCPGCSTYLEEIAGVTQGLSNLESASNIQGSAGFHQRVLRVLEAQAAPKKSLVENLRAFIFAWRFALGGLGATAMALLILALVLRAPVGTLPPPSGPAPAPPQLVSNRSVAPTLANYRSRINESLDGFDHLLDTQANRPGSTSQYLTVSTLAKASLAD